MKKIITTLLATITIGLSAQTYTTDTSNYFTVSPTLCQNQVTAPSSGSACLGVDYTAIATIGVDSALLDSLRWSTTLTGTLSNSDNDTATFNPSAAGSGYLVCTAYYLDQTVKDSTLVVAEFCPDQSYIDHWWAFNNTLTDTIGDATTVWSGTEVEAYTEGYIGNAVDLSFGNHVRYYLPGYDTLTEITFSCWMKTDTANGYIIQYGGTNFYIRTLSNTQLRVNHAQLSTTSYTWNTDRLLSNQWTFISFSWDGDSAFVYINGNASNKIPLTGEIIKTDFSYWYLRQHPHQIDDVRFYNKALSPSELDKVYNRVGVVYYISSTGSDINDGLSASAPFASFEKVDSLVLPGDTIKIKSGDVFTEQITPKNGGENYKITYTFYGNGNKPLLNGSLNLNEEADWVDKGSNVWVASDTFAYDVGNLIFNNEESCGYKLFTEAAIRYQGQFYFDRDSSLLKLYSTSNPALYYSDIKAALTKDIINQSNVSYVVFNNLNISYGGAHGIGGYNTKGITIENCDFSYIGGGYSGGDSIRYGNGVEFWANCSNNLVQYCTFNEIYDAAMTNQSNVDGSVQSNITYRYNTVNNSEYSFEYFNRGTGNLTSEIYFENNACTNAGSGWGHNQRTYVNGSHLMLRQRTDDVTSNFYIRYNTFNNSTEHGIRVADLNDVDDFTVDYNCWYEESGNIANVAGTLYDYATQQEAYKTVTGYDTNSTFENCE